jgi:dTDP-4-amino-4,6-dideoxygalactose transaminase
MVVTRDGGIAKRAALMRLHGIDRAVWNRYTDRRASWYYEVLEPGFKYNMPDILAAIGRVQLGRARQLLSLREEIARRYDEAFRNESKLIVPATGPGNARHLYPLRLSDDINGSRLDRDDLIDKLKEKGIGVSVHFIPLHLMPWYKNRCAALHGRAFEPEDFPAAFAFFKREISLPIWPGMTEAQVGRVANEVLALVH